MYVSVNDGAGHVLNIPAVAVDAVGAEERAAFFAKRSVKQQSKMDLLYLAIRMCDLTTLEGADTPARVRQMCRKALQPAAPALTEALAKIPGFRPIPSVAAVCVYPLLVPHAVKVLQGSGVHVASVATSFPSGQASLAVRLADTREAVASGALTMVTTHLSDLKIYASKTAGFENAAVEFDMGDDLRGHAPGGIEVFPVIPGVGPRQVAPSLNQDPGGNQQEQGDRHQAATQEAEDAVASAIAVIKPGSTGRVLPPGAVKRLRGRNRQAAVALRAIVHGASGVCAGKAPASPM